MYLFLNFFSFSVLYSPLFYYHYQPVFDFKRKKTNPESSTMTFLGKFHNIFLDITFTQFFAIVQSVAYFLSSRARNCHNVCVFFKMMAVLENIEINKIKRFLLKPLACADSKVFRSSTAMVNFFCLARQEL